MTFSYPGFGRRGADDGAPERPGIGVRTAVLQFLAAGLLALLLIAAISYVLLRRESNDEAVRDSRNLTRLIATSVVEPTLAERPDVLSGDPAALRWFDDRMENRVLGDRGVIVRIKLWTTDGRVVYSDLDGLVGKTFPFSGNERTALRSAKPVAEISNLNEPENRTERRQGKLLEVYYPIRGPDGRVLLFETYQRFSAVSSGGAAVLRKFLPIFLLALLVLSLAQAPLAWSMARRLRDSQLDREQLLLTAIEASDRERRRIASEVHDGPVQELAGVSFALAGAADRAQADTPPEVRRSLEDAATATRGVMRQLRGMLVEIHPPNLHTTGLESALSDLLAPLAAKGVETRRDAADVPEMSLDAEALLFRAAQETVRNAVTHANARHVVVAVSRDNGMAQMTISDDGRGFDSEEQDRRQAEGHMGLRILRDLVAHAGGTFELDSTPGQGTTVSIGVPLR
jgi:two-component system, NarL family, sensor kinase